MPIMSLKELYLDSKSPGKATYRTEYDGETHTFTVLPKTVGRPINWKNFQLPLAYAEVIPLKPKLYEDLMWYVTKGHVPTAYHHFYNSLPKPVAGPPKPKQVAQVPQEGDQAVPQEAAQLSKKRRGASQSAKHRQPAKKRTSAGQPLRAKQQSKKRKRKNKPESSSSNKDDPDTNSN